MSGSTRVGRMWRTKSCWRVVLSYGEPLIESLTRPPGRLSHSESKLITGQEQPRMRLLSDTAMRWWSPDVYAPSAAHAHPEVDVDLLTPDLHALLTSGRVRQAAPTTCGSVALLVAAAVLHPDRAEHLLGDLARRERLMARWTRGGLRRVARRSGRQVRLVWPWPRFWGTSPWAAAAAMTAMSGRRHHVHRVDPRRAGGARIAVGRSLTAGLPAPVYVGNTTTPRHVVLVVGANGETLTIFDPGDGRLHTLPWTALETGFRLSGWARVWAVVAPASSPFG